jgi:hypothetical protein
VFVGIKSAQHFYPYQQKQDSTTALTSRILKFDKIYEPSGIQQLADGRLVIIEDEPAHPIHIMNINNKAEMTENKTLGVLLRIAFGRKLDDLEALTKGPDGYLYAATSHKRNKKGKRKADRELLIRFKIEANKIVDTGIVSGLYDAIKTSGVLGAVDKQGMGGLYNLNIEALSFDRKNRLMLGLRNPLINGKSIILIVNNPAAMFAGKQAPVIVKKPILLDLKGGGIRAMSYDNRFKGYLLTNEIYVNDSNNVKYSQISFWDGNPGHKAKPFKLPELSNTNNVEGISPVLINGDPQLMLVSDNGSKKHKRPANYLFLDYDQLLNN